VLIFQLKMSDIFEQYFERKKTVSKRATKSAAMAKNYNIRQSLASYSQNIIDGKERLFFILQKKNNLAVERRITDVTNELSTISLSNIQSLMDRTETSVQIYEMLLDILTNEKRRKKFSQR